MHVLAVPLFRDATGVRLHDSLGPISLLAAILLLGPEHRWCEDPLESALFIIIIIRDEHRWCEDPIESALLLLLLFSKLNRIFEGLKMLEKSGNFAPAPEVAKIYV